MVVISGDALPAASPGENVIETSRAVIASKLKVNVPLEELSSAYRIGKRNPSQAPDKRNILLSFKSSQVKTDVIKAARSIKPSVLFINESLTPSLATVLYGLRRAKRRFPERVTGCGSLDGRVYVWVRRSDHGDGNMRIFINSSSKFDEFCKNTLGLCSTEIFNDDGGRQ